MIDLVGKLPEDKILKSSTQTASTEITGQLPADVVLVGVLEDNI